MGRKKPKNKQIVLFFGAIIVLAALIVIGLKTLTKTEQTITTPQSKSVVVNPRNLAGRWLRPDGGYVLVLSNIGDDGSLDAAYYNPKPINVALAGWRWTDNHLQVYVEFDDVNYRGSNYNLTYLEREDRMVGNYYQAMLKQNFTIQFVRQK